MFICNYFSNGSKKSVIPIVYSVNPDDNKLNPGVYKSDSFRPFHNYSFNFYKPKKEGAMKSFTRFIGVIFAILMTYGLTMAQQQILFEGLVSHGEGIAGWNADGSGPEPFAWGHIVPAPGFSNQYYYGSSHDYITQDPTHAAFHFLPGMTGFPLFEQALADNGFTPEQVKVKYGLCTLGDDIEGLDWFFMNNWAYSNYYENYFLIQLDGHPMLAGCCNYSQMYINTASGNWYTETAYAPVTYKAQFSSLEVRSVAQAFLDDLNGSEIILKYESTYGSAFSGNGRFGAYYNILNGTLEVGNPRLPMQGLNADHEGFAGWDADGTGPEPYGNGHLTQLYYVASLDYDNLDPDPAACLGHFLDGSTGFFNTMLQLQYRGFEIGDLKFKLGLGSLGPDVQGEDWGYQNGQHWCNYYNNNIVFELNGEPILVMLQDTNRLLALTSCWSSESGIGKVYNISQNASPGAQFVALSFLKDIGSHYLKTNTSDVQYHSLFSGNGRDGALYEIAAGEVVGIHQKATFIPEGTLSGVWTTANSPYFIDGHQSIENGQILTILPGVEVKVRGPYRFDVKGCIVAEGTDEEYILFTRSNPNLWWDGIGFDGAVSDTGVTSFFDHCIFKYGYAQGSGHENSGGIFVAKDFSNLEIHNSIFSNNLADIDGNNPPCGGAIALSNSSPVIQNCTFRDNKAEYGGAIFSYSYSNPLISNCLFYNNFGTYGGAIALFDNSDGMYINNTFADNSGGQGGAIYFYWHSDPEIINNIIWGNTADEGDQIYFTAIGPSYPGFYYNDIEGGKEGFHGGSTVDYLFNLDADPLFMGEGPHPYALAGETSPCWNAGTPDTSAWYYPQYLSPLCLCGNIRIGDNRIDIGAYEYMLATGYETPVASVNDGLLIYPNPSTDEIRIDLELKNAGKVVIELYDLSGRLVALPVEQNCSKGIQKLSCNPGQLARGVYNCRITAEGRTITRLLVRN
jgi:hypothetical protein